MVSFLETHLKVYFKDEKEGIAHLMKETHEIKGNNLRHTIDVVNT